MIGRVLGLAAVALAAAGVVGCGSNSSDTNGPTATAGSSGVQVEVGNTITYGSFGTKADIDCADGKSLNIAGSNNTLTVTGTCASVTVSGADNKVSFDKVENSLTALGLNNTLTYKDGDPKVDNLGSGNEIKKG